MPLDGGAGTHTAGIRGDLDAIAVGGKPLDDFPLNKLGRELGFRISNRYTSDPDNSTIDPRLSELRVEIVRRDNQWTGSEIESSEPLHSVLLRDSRARPMIIEVCRDAGRVIVAGRETMLEQNPILCVALLKLLDQDCTSNKKATGINPVAR